MFLEMGFWFVTAAALLLLVVFVLKRIKYGHALAVLGMALGIMVVLTAIFDNVMIAAGLFDYGQQTLLGLYVGRAPIEDFLYPLAAVILMPALWWLFGGKPTVHKESAK
ncbi:lycopene cyclase domain-containing protein [Glutamicibacter sp.]|jgi:lycopene cyclase domain|uniref:lycopene cyclase domain-containing protein n=1 Tax=Glutamicibacter sp. TaxID=1931995 RepID=UPI002B4A2328|nr:lycopene cyclase domain-containing protein [Glutamicibacter sp.]HJX78334.1 lycopene cyclase domain-containing protein [Glutamicibacter sp.]